MKLSFLHSLKSIKFEYKISFSYFLLGLLWIFFSDELLNKMVKNNILITQIQIYKGSFYILVTSILLYILVKNHIKKLKEQKILFETMFDTISDSVIITNTKREIITANKNAKERFGNDDSLVGTTTQKFYKNQEDYNKAGNLVFNAESQNTIFNYIIDYKDKNDVVFPGESFSAKLFDSNEKWIGNLAIIRDITERINNEKEIYEGKVKLEAALESMTDAVFISDTNGQFININEAFASFHKFNNKSECAKTLSDYPEFLEVYLSNGKLASLNEWAVSRALKGEIVSNDEFSLRRKDTGEIWFGSYSFAPIKDKNGLIIGSVVVARDITETRLAQNELIKAKERAEESDRLKTVFLQNISHEIRTPMNAIIGFSELLCDSDLSSTQQNTYKEIIVNSSNQLLSIVNDILTISILETKQIKPKLTSVNINNLIEEITSNFNKRYTEKGIELKVTIDLSNPFYIATDDVKIKQVITNLISNALKFTFLGYVEIGYINKNNFLEFYVKDTGIGIKPELHRKIFEPFGQANTKISETFGGTGLGLSISKEFIELLGGEMSIESEEGVGSTFRFYIPLITNTLDKINSNTISKLKKPTILIAEDEEYNYLLIKELFSDIDAILIHAWNGKEVIELWDQNPEISIVLMDLKMPLIDGYQASKILKEKNPELHIIAISSYAMPEEKEKANDCEFEAYLTKPIDKNKFLEVINNYIEN